MFLLYHIFNLQYYEEEGTDDLPIKIEVVSEVEYNLEGVMLFNVTDQVNIEVDGKAVNINELMSRVNEYHDTPLSLDDWICVYPLPLEHTHDQLLVA